MTEVSNLLPSPQVALASRRSPVHSLQEELMALRRRVAIAAAFGIASTAALTPTATAEEAVRPGAGAQAIEGSYIVVLKDGARTSASALASRYQGSVKHTYSAALHGFSVTGMSERQARRLAADADVDFVERNTFATIQETQSNPAWHLD